MNEYMRRLDKRIEGYQRRERELIEDDRKDEANFVKIRINICEICKTLYQVSLKEINEMAIQKSYMKQIEKLFKSWESAYEKAKEHKDENKMMIEQLKIEELESVREIFARVVLEE